ncbi:SGNH/GDSL hydrolase family protein [Cryobacterium sp. TMT3-29-2]|uniref:SGNH/GDSL hydrolase family protein n=1 Tax=Cryobacterium sp. TMT3-29-2 TaxID=2555867 RepID=UPI0010747EF9|nr:SGNH/GDSL hydrolase family protein [Cryobacterium sp. TMT3-29-2]TFC84611.1 SGNH/GDSL hydrolase family protein [Cryobacterium sp. TMT3-29-2]
MPPRPGRRSAAGIPTRRVPYRVVVLGLAALSVAALCLGALGLSGVFPFSPPAADSTVQVDRPDERPLRVLFVGDSISYGLNAERQDLGFRPLMVDALSADGPIQEFHKNRAGATTRTVSRLVDVPENLDLAVVELGTNDVVHQTAPDEFARSYRALLRRLHTESPGVPLLCVGTWGSAGGADGSDAYNTLIDEECARQGGAFVSLYGLYPVEANRGPAGRDVFGGASDRFHPNDTGYRAIADLLLGRIAVH